MRRAAEGLKTAAKIGRNKSQRGREALGAEEDTELVVRAVSGERVFDTGEKELRDWSGDRELLFTFRV